jgi:hypothetical protein
LFSSFLTWAQEHPNSFYIIKDVEDIILNSNDKIEMIFQGYRSGQQPASFTRAFQRSVRGHQYSYMSWNDLKATHNTVFKDVSVPSFQAGNIALDRVDFSQFSVNINDEIFYIPPTNSSSQAILQRGITAPVYNPPDDFIIYRFKFAAESMFVFMRGINSAWPQIRIIKLNKIDSNWISSTLLQYNDDLNIPLTFWDVSPDGKENILGNGISIYRIKNGSLIVNTTLNRTTCFEKNKRTS